VLGGAIAFLVDERLLAGAFALLMVYVALTMARGLRRPTSVPTPDEESVAADAELADAAIAEAALADAAANAVPDEEATTVDADAATLGLAPDKVRLLPAAAAASVGAGVASALLGIGGGIIKVPLMHVTLGVPLRISTATSNLMVGITASTSAIVYLLRGGIDAYAAGPTAVGVLIGASLGSRLGPRIDVRSLRIAVVAVLLYTASQMASRALAS
jgi:uncharacterized membrane protein YfcA